MTRLRNAGIITEKGIGATSKGKQLLKSGFGALRKGAVSLTGK